MLLSCSQAVVVGCFNFAGNIGSHGYYSFYTTALKFLERDPYREVGFAAVTSMNLCAQMGFDWSPAFGIYTWNETLVCRICYLRLVTLTLKLTWLTNIIHNCILTEQV